MIFKKNYTMKRYHFVENIQGLGRIYATIYIYVAIENTIKQENWILLKLQFYRMNNKTRLYKYLLNYFDINTYKLIPPEIFNEDNPAMPTLKQRLDYDQRILVQVLKERLL